MTMPSTIETIKVQGTHLIEQIKQLVHEGNVRRIVVSHEGQTVAEFPLTVGIVGAVLAPTLAAIGALVALLTDCTIEIERVVLEAPPAASPADIQTMPVIVAPMELEPDEMQEAFI